MNELEFKRLILTFGSKAQNWPQDQRAALNDYLQQNPDKKALVEPEQALDGFLDTYPISTPSANLKMKILNRIPEPISMSVRNFFQPVFPKIVSFAFALFLGIGLGFYQNVYQEEMDALYNTTQAMIIDDLNDEITL